MENSESKRGTFCPLLSTRSETGGIKEQITSTISSICRKNCAWLIKDKCAIAIIAENLSKKS